MVLALARSSEPWCFPAGSCFFSKLFYCQQYCQQLQAIESRQKGFFSRISAFFEAVLLPVAAGNRISRSLEKRCFSRILGYFFPTLFYCLSKKVSPCSFREKVLTGDFVEKRGLQNTNPSRRMAPNALQNTSLGNPKWLPTTKYKTKITKNHQIRAVYKIDWKKSCPFQGSKVPKTGFVGYVQTCIL